MPNTMPSALKDFYLNEVMRNDVKTYLVDFLKVQAIEKVFNKEETNGVADAKKCIDEAFNNLEILFTPQSEGKDVINEAR